MTPEQMNSEWVAEEGRNENDWFVRIRIGGKQWVVVGHIPQGTAEHIRDTHNASLKVPLWTSEHVRVYDYNRYGVVAFSGLQWPPVDVTKMLADERTKLTVKVYLDD